MIKMNEGILKTTKIAYEARLLNLNNLKDIMKLQATVYEQLIDKSKLERLTEEEFSFILSDNGLMIGIYVENKLIATRALLVPADDPDHLGLAIGLKETEIDKVIYQEISFVHPDYQGNGLQKLMAELIMKELHKKKHSYTYVCATVAPDNIPSLKDKFSQGMELRAFVIIYGEKQRYVFVKELAEHENKVEVIKEVKIELVNVNEIKRYLDLNWVGIELFQENDNYFMRFIEYKL